MEDFANAIPVLIPEIAVPIFFDNISFALLSYKNKTSRPILMSFVVE